MDIIQLISSVHHRKALWDQSHPDHRNRFILDKLWKEVAQDCNETVKQVSQKWKNLRDYFRREYKKIPVPRSGDPGEEPFRQSSWPYFKSLLFLKDQFSLISQESKTISTPSTLEDEDEEIKCEKDPDEEREEVDMLFHETVTADIFASSSSAGSEAGTILRKKAGKRASYEQLEYLSRKQQRTSTSNVQIQNTDDEDQQFFDSLLPHVRKISSYRKLHFRNDVQTLVQKYAYEENLCNYSDNTTV